MQKLRSACNNDEVERIAVSARFYFDWRGKEKTSSAREISEVV